MPSSDQRGKGKADPAAAAPASAPSSAPKRKSIADLVAVAQKTNVPRAWGQVELELQHVPLDKLREYVEKWTRRHRRK